jgi:hypothetical protein
VSIGAKFLLTIVFVIILLIPAIGEVAAAPVLAMLGTLWGIVPSEE